MHRSTRWAWRHIRAAALLLTLSLSVWATGAGVGRATSFHTGSCATSYVHTSGSQLLDACGNGVILHALNWYGFDSNDFAAGGLHYWSYKTIINRIKSLGYNALRIPFSNELVERNPVVSNLTSICVGQSCLPVPGTISTPLTGAYLLAAANDGGANNADLIGLTALHILKTIVDYAGQQGLYVILDDHRSEAAWGPEEDGLWYTSLSCPAAAAPFTCYTPQSWLNDWATLGSLFQNDPAVTGMDLRNEPHWVNPAVSGGAGRWQPTSCALFVEFAHWGPCGGQNDPATDWAQAATQAGDELLAANSHWLMFVEGGSTYYQDPQDANPTVFTQDSWGENLQGVVSDPIIFSVAGRPVSDQLVYSAHDYRWYQTNDTVADMYSTWTRNFGFVTAPGQPYTAPLWIGEFGSCTHANQCDQATLSQNEGGFWFSTFMGYLQNGDPANNVPGDINWSYWPVNGTYSNSWDYGSNNWRTCYGQREDYGVLGGDWMTLASPLLQSMLIPSTPAPTPTATVVGTATPTTAVTATATATATSVMTGTTTPTATMPPTVTNTATVSATTTATATIPAGATVTVTPGVTMTPTPTETGTPAAGPTGTATPVPTPTLGPPTQWGTYTCAPIPTTTPLPPVNTPIPPAATNTNTPEPATPTALPTRAPLPTSTPRPALPTATPRPTSVPPSLPLEWRTSAASVQTGGALVVMVHTGARALVGVEITVVRSKTVWSGRGKRRHKIITTTVVYQVTGQGVADRRGWLTLRLRIGYKPSGATRARLTIAARRGGLMASRSADVTIMPPPPLSFSMSPRVATSGDRVMVTARTAPLARVVAQVVVRTTRRVTVGTGRRRKSLIQTVTLYQTTIHGAASRQGRFTGQLLILYRVAKPLRAILTVFVVTRQGAASGSAEITIQPRRWGILGAKLSRG